VSGLHARLRRSSVRSKARRLAISVAARLPAHTGRSSIAHAASHPPDFPLEIFIMHQTQSCAALFACIVLAAHAQLACATQPSAGGSGTVAIGNTVKGNFSAGSNGSATSYAQNAEAATAGITALANNTPHYTQVNAGITGATTTDSSGKAYNVSTGSGSGSAMSSGYADTSVQGALGIHTVTSGFNGGNAGTQTNNQIVAGTNQGSYVSGQTLSGFDVQLNYAKSGGGVSIADTKSGYASGANSSGALAGMNAAGIASLGASGQFFTTVKLSAGTGNVTAP
jgi:hypothetical protein